MSVFVQKSQKLNQNRLSNILQSHLKSLVKIKMKFNLIPFLEGLGTMIAVSILVYGFEDADSE